MNVPATTNTSVHVSEFLLEPPLRSVEFVSPRTRPEEMLLGRLLGFDDEGHPRVVWPGLGEATPVTALTLVSLALRDIGRDVLLSFVTRDHSQQPVILGLLQKPTPMPATQSAPSRELEVLADGKRLLLQAQEEVTLRCGKASITLTKAGKVLIEGDYVLSRSRGVHRIQGGSVQIN